MGCSIRPDSSPPPVSLSHFNILFLLLFLHSHCLLGDAEYWLCGKTFTIADIYLSCLLHRLTFVGQAERLFLSKRPLLTDYYNRVLLRKSFRKECVYANNVFWSMFMPMLRAKVKKARPFLFVVSAIAIGVIAYYKKEEIIDIGNEMFVKFKSLFPEVDTD